MLPRTSSKYCCGTCNSCDKGLLLPLRNDADAHAYMQVAGRLAPGHVAYTLLLNQTAIHGVPAAINAANSALLRAFTGNANASMRVTNYPLPTVSDEDAVKVSQMSGKRGKMPWQADALLRPARTPCTHWSLVTGHSLNVRVSNMK